MKTTTVVAVLAFCALALAYVSASGFAEGYASGLAAGIAERP